MKEDEQLLDFFVSKIPHCDDLEGIKNYIEGMYYEQKMRCKEKNKLNTKLKASIDKRLDNIKNARVLITKLHKEVQLFKRFYDRKSQRHSGKYKDPEIEKLKANSSIYDWIVDIDLITTVNKDSCKLFLL